LEPLRSLVEDKATVPGKKDEESGKINALQGIQEICDKMASHRPSLQFTLYCPFHSELVDNWHIQVTFSPQDEPLVLSDDNATSTEETDDGVIVWDPVQSPISANNDASDIHVPSTQGQVCAQDGDKESPQTPSFQTNSRLGILGIDYIEHKVQPDDTLQGICLLYNVELFRLKQANLLSGENESLLLAPHKVLAIPKSEGFYSRVQETESKDYKLSELRKQFPKLSKKEATAYLELADWVLDDAVATAREDIQWEKEAKDDLF
jgi:hypothetical protein